MNGKFRVWDKVSNVLYKEYHDFYISHDGSLFMENDRRYLCEPDMISVSSERYIIQFFTGLQDKNGLDIYCGDILKIEGKNICKVVWDGPGFDVRPYITQECNGLEYSVIEGISEILGNIYENPELLK